VSFFGGDGLVFLCSLGRVYHLDVDETERVLPSGGCAVGSRTDERVYGGYQVFGCALQVAQGEYEQGGFGGILSGGGVAAHWVGGVFGFGFLGGAFGVDGAICCRILQKHIKRQIISLQGGFQVIADLNTYHAFISSLKVRVFC
jgi:hypothetical protein